LLGTSGVGNNLYPYGPDRMDIKLDVETVGMTRTKIHFSKSLQLMNFAQDFFYVRLQRESMYTH
jgi:hypothetical protein